MNVDDPSLTESVTSAASADWATAFHEAGHAVVALLMGRAVERVSIVPNCSRLGHCQIGKGSSRRCHDPVETEAMILLAGLAAESRWTDRDASAGAAQDLRYVRKLCASRANGERQQRRLEERWFSKTEHLLDQSGHWEAIASIAKALIEHRQISGRTARHLLDQVIRAHSD